MPRAITVTGTATRMVWLRRLSPGQRNPGQLNPGRARRARFCPANLPPGLGSLAGSRPRRDVPTRDGPALTLDGGATIHGEGRKARPS